ncbi:hypothetical protein GCM10009110_17820 [Psychrobacter piscatorii]
MWYGSLSRIYQIRSLNSLNPIIRYADTTPTVVSAFIILVIKQSPFLKTIKDKIRSIKNPAKPFGNAGFLSIKLRLNS